MRRALSTHLYRKHRITPAILKEIASHGAELIELFCARNSFDYRDRDQISSLAGWFRNSQTKLHSLHSPIHSDEYGGRSGPAALVNLAETEKIRRRDAVDEVKRALEVAEAIPFPFLVQHVGAPYEDFEDRKIDAIFASLSELNVFARDRSVEILIENIPNGFSSSDKLAKLLEVTHLDNDFCFDTGHAHIMEGVETAFDSMKERIRSTHVHDNDGKEDIHLFPFVAEKGTIDWGRAMDLLRSRETQYPLMLELREADDIPLDRVPEVFDRLEEATAAEVER